ncbi:MAG: thermonuclease family protein [Alphaproteobacteria bacterium]
MAFRLGTIAPLLALGFVIGPVAATAPAEITGPAHVIDGDTLEIHGERVWLYGIDAPERKQPCWLGRLAYPCGMVAKGHLMGLIGRQEVRCQKRDRDSFGRLAAVCFVGDRDVGETLVRDGWALAYPRHSLDYVHEEAEARREGRGIWAGTFTPPWEWRRGNRTNPE